MARFRAIQPFQARASLDGWRYRNRHFHHSTRRHRSRGLLLPRASRSSIGPSPTLAIFPIPSSSICAAHTVLMLESNHDLDMLKVGPYPWAVKQRVMSRNGHLSNHLVGDDLGHEFDSSATALILGHLSEHNNHPLSVGSVVSRREDGAVVVARSGNPEAPDRGFQVLGTRCQLQCSGAKGSNFGLLAPGT